MGTDAIGFILALLTIGMSFIAVRYRNMLLVLGASILWATLLAFILANTTAGTTWQTMFLLGALAFICAFALIGFIARKGESVTRFREEGGEMTAHTTHYEGGSSSRGLMDLSTDEYRALVRARLRRRRR